MAYSELQKNRALDYFFNISNNVDQTVAEFGYPERSTLWLWVKKDPRFDEEKNLNKVKYPLDMRIKAVKMMLDNHMSGIEVTRQLGIDNHVSVYLWKKAYLAGGIEALAPKRDW